MALAMTGVLITQMFHIIHSIDPEPTFYYSDTSTPLACTCHTLAILWTAFGAFRFWRQQNAMARGKAYAGGWELIVIGITALLVSNPGLILDVS